MDTMANTKKVLILIHGRKISAWRLGEDGGCVGFPIKGETALNVGNIDSFEHAWLDLKDRLKSANLEHAKLLWVADSEGRQWCLEKQVAQWQFPWEWIADKFQLSDAGAPASPWRDAIFLNQKIVPWFFLDAVADQTASLEKDRMSAFSKQRDELVNDIELLRKKNEELREENSALQEVDPELLVRFLPALYPRVFTLIGPVDLAALCGKVEPLVLPNPYPEPAEETLRVLQKKFKSLPIDKQLKIVGFMGKQPNIRGLKVRAEMRNLVEKLIGDNFEY